MWALFMNSVTDIYVVLKKETYSTIPFTFTQLYHKSFYKTQLHKNGPGSGDNGKNVLAVIS